MSILVYGKDGCSFCKRTVDFLSNKHIDFHYLSLGKDYQKSFIIENYPSMRTFPVIVVDGNLVGGYTELVEAAADENFGLKLIKG